MKGIIKGFHKPTGQVVTAERVYDFNVECVYGSIQNNQEVDFIVNDEEVVTRIDGEGIEEEITEELFAIHLMLVL